jgi:uncharacterized membrane protein (DUF2068 family)
VLFAASWRAGFCRADHPVMSDSPLPAPRSLGVLRVIAVFKFVKAAFVIATGFGLLRFYDPVVTQVLFRLAHDLPYAFEQRLVRDAIAFLSGMSPRHIQIIAAATFTYAGLFLVEGVGLWRGLFWAEILTIIATSSLIPVEVWEIHRHFTASRVLVLVGNVAIVAYLIWRLRRESRAHRAALARARATD